jgi:hypothetical protein
MQKNQKIKAVSICWLKIPQKPKLRKLAQLILPEPDKCGWRSNSAQFLTVSFWIFMPKCSRPEGAQYGKEINSFGWGRKFRFGLLVAHRRADAKHQQQSNSFYEKHILHYHRLSVF